MQQLTDSSFEKKSLIRRAYIFTLVAPLERNVISQRLLKACLNCKLKRIRNKSVLKKNYPTPLRLEVDNCGQPFVVNVE